MGFFILGLAAGAVYVVSRSPDPFFLFAGLVFFVGSISIGAMVQAQMTMAKSLREKSMEVMRGFVNSIEMKDAYTRGHSWHVYHIVQMMVKSLPEGRRKLLNVPKLLDAALLHDIGKMGVPDEVLNKQGPLNEAEWEAVRTHPVYAQRMLRDTCFSEIGEWVLYHHERIDGRGYLNLPGDKIPMEARIIAVADTYSAMMADREYRPKRTHAEAVEVMRQVAGIQLDGELVACLCAVPEDGLNTPEQFLADAR
jgi:HD-GYP domain-containing protein (c-di-GMP phosphodiesterase class II)